MRRLLLIATSALLLAAVFLASACQQAAAPPSSQSAQPKASASTAPAKDVSEVTQLTIGTMPVANVTTMALADKLGYFKDEGFTKIELTFLGGGAELLPALQAGKLQFAHSNVASIIQGRDQGFDFSLVAGNTRVPAKPPESQIIMVKADSPIKTAKDLAGKKIAINNLNNIIWLYCREVVRRAGADPNTVQFMEIPFPNMADALLNGQVDAISTLEPFLTRALDTGKVRELATMYAEITPNLDMAVWAGSEKWMKEHPNATTRFFRAFSRAVDYIKADNNRARKEMAAYTKTDEALAMKMRLDGFSAKINPSVVQQTADLMLKDGLTKNKVDIAKMVYQGAVE